MTSTTDVAPRVAGSTVSAGYVRALADFAVSQGADRAKLLSLSGLSEDEIADVDARVAMVRYVAMFDAAVALTRDPAIALHYGKGRSHAGDFDRRPHLRGVRTNDRCRDAAQSLWPARVRSSGR